MPGPPPTPTEQLKARGSRLVKKRKGEPKPNGILPTCPKILKGEARVEWKRMCARLAAMRILDSTDRGLLTAYCEAWGDYVEAVQELRTAGKLITTPSGTIKRNPLMAVRRDAFDRMRAMADRLGIGPTARARAHVEAQQHGEDQTQGKGRFFRTVG